MVILMKHNEKSLKYIDEETVSWEDSNREKIHTHNIEI